MWNNPKISKKSKTKYRKFMWPLYIFWAARFIDRNSCSWVSKLEYLKCWGNMTCPFSFIEYCSRIIVSAKKYRYSRSTTEQFWPIDCSINYNSLSTQDRTWGTVDWVTSKHIVCSSTVHLGSAFLHAGSTV